MDYAKMTHIGQVREKNEDHCYADGKLFMVADGMGGHARGEIASFTAVHSCAHYFQRTTVLKNQKDIEEAIHKSMKTANDQIFEMNRLANDGKSMGTTLSIGYLKDSVLYIGHVGDSRIYLLRDGHLIQLTDDHSLASEMEKLGMENELIAPKNIITRYIGIKKTVNIDFASIELRLGDVIVFVTDGVTNLLENQRIVDLIASTDHIARACNHIIKAANEMGGIDNMTVMLLKYDKNLPREVQIDECR